MTLDTNYDGYNLLHYVLPSTSRGVEDGFVGIRDANGIQPKFLGSRDASLFIDLDDDIRAIREKRISPQKVGNLSRDYNRDEQDIRDSPHRQKSQYMTDEVQRLGGELFNNFKGQNRQEDVAI